ncbi:MAG TPA: isoprenylcysteine carboxylmethyltransferase family protein [Solirubrobacteraceae bacterium]|jgi:protein-S-isoprenylcysteine O-methyltransferase Ste14|nr:isoprenylcysteine carboxylmethyltransferase family protein [Solirubrobacteraceae bacterium]
MQTLRTAVGIAWAVFWVGWLLAAFTAKGSVGRGWGRLGPRGIAAIAVVILIRAKHAGGLEVHSIVVGVIGTVVFATGVAVAIWARVILGRNWGMPTTQRLEPELITAGPYGVVRHPIYTGILLGVLGTGLVINFIGLGIAVILGGYFVWAATVEERNLTATFPSAYPAYRARTKMLIPFLL